MDWQSLNDEYKKDAEALKNVTDTFDELEGILASEVQDSLSGDFRSRVTDSRLATINIEAAGRIMAQLPSGVVKALTRKDRGKALLMNIVLHRHVIPNCNWQYDYLTKLFLWDLYSRVYGVMPMMYDYDVSPNYTGPNCRLVPIRNLTLPAGVLPNDAEHTYLDTWHSPEWLERQIDRKGSKWSKEAVERLLEMHENGIDKKEYEKQTYIERQRYQQGEGQGQGIRLVTRYERGKEGKWITFAPDYNLDVGDGLLRNIENPHHTGRIPIVFKWNMPLLDTWLGLGEFKRGKPLQYAMDSLTNMYLDSIKTTIFPTKIVNPNGVVPSSLKAGPDQTWLETIPNSIRAYETSPKGMNTFQSTMTFLIGAMLNQAGTTDTAQNAETTNDPGFGKTPQALKMQQARENTKDTMDRRNLEQAIEELQDGFVNLIAKAPAGEKPIDVNVFGEEIEQIKALGYKDIDDIMTISESGGTAKIRISRDKLGKDVDYKYFIEPGSTQGRENAEQLENLTNIVMLVGKVPGVTEMMKASGWKLDMGELFRQVISKSGLEDIDRIVYPLEEDDTTPEMEAAAASQAPPQMPPEMMGQPAVNPVDMTQAPLDAVQQMMQQAQQTGQMGGMMSGPPGGF